MAAQTFVAGLRCHELVAPWIVQGTMDGAAFDTYVRTQLAPSLKAGDVVILDNLNVHKSPRAAKVVAERGAWLMFLPKYSPDLNPIEMRILKAQGPSAQGGRSHHGQSLARRRQHSRPVFTSDECWNYLNAAGYVAH